MKADIILYHPRLSDAGHSVTRDSMGAAQEFFGPPLGLLQSLTGFLHAADQVSIIDWQVEAEPYETLAAKMSDCTVFGVSALTGPQISDGLRATALAKKINPKVKVVWGGWHATQLPRQTLEHPLIDFVVVGSGEGVFPKLVERVRNNALDSAWSQGVWYKSGDEVIENGRAPAPDLASCGALPYELLRMEAYLAHFSVLGHINSDRGLRNPRCFAFVSQLGCPFACSFCEITKLYERRTYYVPVDKALNDLEFLVRHYNVEEIYFFSPEFFVNLKYAQAFCQGMIDRGLNIRWGASTRVDSLLRAEHRQVLDLAIQSGCFHLNIGIEAVSPALQQKIHKAEYTPEDSINAVHLLYAKGLSTQLNLILGWPFETDRDLKLSKEAVRRIAVANPIAKVAINFWKPFPSVPAFDEALKAGYQPPPTLEGWGSTPMSHSMGTEVPWISSRRKKRIKREMRFAAMGELLTECHKKNRRRRKLFTALRMANSLRMRVGFYGFPAELSLYNTVSKEFIGTQTVGAYSVFHMT